jgi:CRISPR-associated RAMP protein (TIGR02581 family)
MRDEIMPIRERDETIQKLAQSGNIVAIDRQLSQRIWNKSTLIDLTFGAPWTAGRIFFKDALIDRSLWAGRFEVRNGVGLNRDTETVEQGLLYDYEVVPAGMRFDFELVLENAADWQLGMVLLALRPWQNGDVQIGGFRSRGMGHVQLTEVAARYTRVETPDDVLSLLGYGESGAIDLPLARLPGVRPAPVDAEPPLESVPEPLKGWFDAFRDTLKNPQAAITKGATFDA